MNFKSLMHKREKGLFLLLFPVVPLLVLLRSQTAQSAAAGGPFESLSGLMAPATVISWSSDGKSVTCASLDDGLQTWDANAQSWRKFVSMPRASAYRSLPTRLYYSRDGRQLFVPQPRNAVSVQVFDTNTRRAIWDFSGPSWSAFAMSNDRKMAAYGDDTGIGLTNLTSKALPPDPRRFDGPTRRNFVGHWFFRTGSAPSCLSFSPDGRTLAVGWNEQIFLLDTRPPLRAARLQSDLQRHSLAPLQFSNDNPDPFKFEWGSPIFIEWSPDGRSIAVLSKAALSLFDAQLHLRCSVPVGQKAQVGTMIPGAQSGIGANIVWSRDSQTLWSGGDEVRQWRARDLTMERAFGVSGPVALSPDEKILATASSATTGTSPAVWKWKLK